MLGIYSAFKKKKKKFTPDIYAELSSVAAELFCLYPLYNNF